MRIHRALILFMFCACGKTLDARSAARETYPTAPVPSSLTVLNTESGRYKVLLNGKLNPKTLPSNADLKMRDGNIAEYARHLCGLDYANALRPDRCDVYVQADTKALLVGYAAILQGQDVTIETAIQTDRRRKGLGCFIEGPLENTDFNHPGAKLDASKDFQARLSYIAWEKSPGDWVVSFGDNSEDTEGAGGMWYIKRTNEKLRINQERWSYCYSRPDVYIDEVFLNAVTLIRIADPAGHRPKR
jgi:hypothetical protein